MHRLAPVALATLLAATAPAILCAQAPTPFTVPPAAGHLPTPPTSPASASAPRNGRELPIDGGLSPRASPTTPSASQQLLRKLNTRASLMLIVAHPDDEDGGMLTYYSRGLGARVAILTLNRGEGGQNQMTGDFEDALGLLRTQELLSADRYMGVDPDVRHRGRLRLHQDQGRSLPEVEPPARPLRRRPRRPHLPPAHHRLHLHGAVTDGHGQHQVSGQIAQEVFKAAGDPNVFPELTREGILPWQPLKVYARVPFSRVTAQGLYDYATGQTVPAEFTNYVTGQKFTTEPTADVTIHEGAHRPTPHLRRRRPRQILRPSQCRPQQQPSATSNSPASASASSAPRSAAASHPTLRPLDVGYHLYGSRVCAPNLPNPTPTSDLERTTATDHQHSGCPTLDASDKGGVSRAAR